MTVISMNKKDQAYTECNTWVVDKHRVWQAVDGNYYKSASPYEMRFFFRNSTEKEIAEYLSHFGFPWESIDWS